MRFFVNKETSSSTHTTRDDLRYVITIICIDRLQLASTLVHDNMLRVLVVLLLICCHVDALIAKLAESITRVKDTAKINSIDQCYEDVVKNESCSLTALNMSAIRSEIAGYRSSGVQLINFYLSGVELNVSSSENDTTFNPYWWMWVSAKGTFILDMPIDYDILSVGLLTLKVEDIDFKLESKPKGCLQKLNHKCRYALIHKVLDYALEIGKSPTGSFGDYICRTAYTHRSFITKKLVGVGPDCCMRDIYPYRNNKICTKTWDKKHGVIRVILFVLGLVLPLVVLYMMCVSPDVRPHKISKGIVSYLTNRLQQIDHFYVKGDGSLAGHTVLVDQNDLLPYTTAASMWTFSDFHFPIRPSKIGFTAVFMSQYVALGWWLYKYSNAPHYMNYLDTHEKIAFNLRNVPVSWLITNKEFWPFVISLILVSLSFFNVLLVMFWWLTELSCVRRALLNTLIKVFIKPWSECQDNNSKAKRRSKKWVYMMPNLESAVHRLLIFVIIAVGCGSYLVIYSLFHMVMYILTGTVLNIQIITPWLTGVSLAIYYVYKMFANIRSTYTEIQRTVFQECLSGELPVYKARVVTTSCVHTHNVEKMTIRDPDGILVHYENTRADKAIVFYNDSHVPMIQSRLFFHICRELSPFAPNFRRALVSLFATLLFMFLIIFTMTVFNREGQSEISMVVTSVVTLLAALLPQFGEMFANEQVNELKKEFKRYRVTRKIKAFRPYVMNAVKSITCSPWNTNSACQSFIDGGGTPLEEISITKIKGEFQAPTYSEFLPDSKLDSFDSFELDKKEFRRQTSGRSLRSVDSADIQLAPLKEVENERYTSNESVAGRNHTRSPAKRQYSNLSGFGKSFDLEYIDESGSQSKEIAPLIDKENV
ncbi:uncharacterized protein LOC141904577 [Tubulanus polymorphus]|uniref:uncharacterized protein LOC141904577 n=1 Tax=Tubulanus polymorphus TaxID=672921 RepID=UPI003DA28A40